MHFTSGINRPPYEARSGYLQVTSGCSHASYTLCGYFKDTAFKVSPIEEIEADVKEIRDYFGEPERIFLQEADAFAADYNTLMKTAELNRQGVFLHKYVPSVKTIGGYARIDNFCGKSIDQLEAMRSAGFSDPYIGVESGDDVILTMSHKGYNAKTAREQLEKINASGMSFIANFLNGLGGKDYGRRQAGQFTEATERERLEEMKEFVRCLTNKTVFLADHISVPFSARVELPEHKQELLDGIQKIIDRVSEESLRIFRDTHPIM